MGARSVKQPGRSLISSHIASHGDIIFKKALNVEGLGCPMAAGSELHLEMVETQASDVNQVLLVSGAAQDIP